MFRLIQAPGLMVEVFSVRLFIDGSKFRKDISRQAECRSLLVPERHEVEIKDGLQRGDLLRTVNRMRRIDLTTVPREALGRHRGKIEMCRLTVWKASEPQDIEFSSGINIQVNQANTTRLGNIAGCNWLVDFLFFDLDNFHCNLCQDLTIYAAHTQKLYRSSSTTSAPIPGRDEKQNWDQPGGCVRDHTTATDHQLFDIAQVRVESGLLVEWSTSG